MNSWVDRRAIIFFVFAVACFALTPLAPSDLNYMGWLLGIVYFALGVLSWLDRIVYWRTRPATRSGNTGELERP